MLKLDELWIGDTLMQRSTGVVCKYNGHKGHMVKVLVADHQIEISANDLRTHTVTENDDLEFEAEDRVTINKPSLVPDQIDLHIEVLAPHMLTQSQARILDFQLEKAAQYIDKALSVRKFKILIIHGKGTGLLKREIESLLQDYDSIRFSFDKNDGGATEVWLDI